MRRKKQVSVEIDEDDKLILVKLTQRRKIKQKDLLGYYVQIDNEYDIYKGDWKARLKELDEKLNESSKKVTHLEGECSALIYAEEFHWCVWGRDGKTPDKK